MPGGGLSINETRWVSCRPGFFLPVRVLPRLFRRLFLHHLQNAFDTGQLQFSASLQALSDRDVFADHLEPVRRAEWVVYAKPPFAGPPQVLDHVGRYTHRVAISNHRLIDIDEGYVRVHYKNSRAERSDVQKTMTLAAPEFMRRFLLHVLPPGFHRIRYYGLLSHRHRAAKLHRCRQCLGTASPPNPVHHTHAHTDYRDRYAALTGVSLRPCPRCQTGRMLVVEPLVGRRRGPAIMDTS